LPQQESVEFVEIFSEQGLQLLFFSVGETDPAETQQWATIELSEGRTLEACLALREWTRPAGHFNEPLLEDMVAQAPLELVKDAGSEAPAVASCDGYDDQYSSLWLSWLFRFLRLRITRVHDTVKRGKAIETSRSSIPDTTRSEIF